MAPARAQISPTQWFRSTRTRNFSSAVESVVAVSMPKCGTHLLGRLLSELTGCHRSQRSLRTESPDEARAVLEEHRSRPNHHSWLRGHQVHTPEIEALVRESGFRILLIMRDPRDMVVSHAHWVTTDAHGSNANRSFYHSLSTMDERLMASICGRPAGWNEGPVQPDEEASLTYHRVRENVGCRIRRYLPWLRSSVCHVVRFEALVGPHGGGAQEAQYSEIAGVADFIGIPRDDVNVQQIGERLFSPKARTFRSGQIGGWTQAFGKLHKLAFKSVAGRELIQLGYETDFDW